MRDEKVILTLKVQSPGVHAVTITAKVVFSNKYAVNVFFDPTARYGQDWTGAVLFDLQRMAWYDQTRQRWIDLQSCEEWEKTTIERTRQSLSDSTEPEIKAFVEATIAPRFQVNARRDGIIEISNSHLTYLVTPGDNTSQQRLVRLWAYDVLNAYHKAMTDRKLAPTAQVAVDRILKQRKIVPATLDLRIKTGKGEVTYASKYEFKPADESDTQILHDALSTAHLLED